MPGSEVQSKTAQLIEKHGFPADKRLGAGVVDGRSVWADGKTPSAFTAALISKVRLVSVLLEFLSSKLETTMTKICMADLPLRATEDRHGLCSVVDDSSTQFCFGWNGRNLSFLPSFCALLSTAACARADRSSDRGCLLFCP